MVDSGRMAASASVRWYPITASLLSLCHTQPPCAVPYLNETLQHSVMISSLSSLFSYHIKSAYLNGELNRELIPELSGQATGSRRIVDSPLLNMGFFEIFNTALTENPALSSTSPPHTTPAPVNPTRFSSRH